MSARRNELDDLHDERLERAQTWLLQWLESRGHMVIYDADPDAYEYEITLKQTP